MCLVLPPNLFYNSNGPPDFRANRPPSALPFQPFSPRPGGRLPASGRGSCGSNFGSETLPDGDARDAFESRDRISQSHHDAFMTSLIIKTVKSKLRDSGLFCVYFLFLLQNGTSRFTSYFFENDFTLNLLFVYFFYFLGSCCYSSDNHPSYYCVVYIYNTHITLY